MVGGRRTVVGTSLMKVGKLTNDMGTTVYNLLYSSSLLQKQWQESTARKLGRL